MKPFLKRIKILENQLFESLANARKLYSNKIEPSIFEQLVSIDTSKTYKYIEKICKFYLQDTSIDFEELKNNIELFDRLSSKNLLDIKDINRFKTYNEFNEYVSSNSDKMSKSEEQRLLKNKGSEVVLNNGKYLVLLIKNEQASIQYGANTKWCISATDSKNYFDSYNKNRVAFYFVFNKKLDSSNPLYKIAVAVYYNGKLECYNAIDERVSFSKLNLPKDLFKSIKLKPKEERLLKIIKGTYKINSDGLIDVDGSVNFLGQKLNSFLEVGKFGTVTGDFDCSYNNLTSLEGCPKIVMGNFNCTGNKLTSLDWHPEKIGKSFEFSENNITSLEDLLITEINGNFSCHSNKLTSLKGCPIKVKRDFTCSNNKSLTSLEGCPVKVGRHFNCWDSNLTSLKGSPTRVGGNFSCQHNNLESLEGSPIKVGGNFSCQYNKLKSLKGFPEYIGGDLSCHSNKKQFTEEDILEICDVKGRISA